MNFGMSEDILTDVIVRLLLLLLQLRNVVFIIDLTLSYDSFLQTDQIICQDNRDKHKSLSILT